MHSKNVGLNESIINVLTFRGVEGGVLLYMLFRKYPCKKLNTLQMIG